jgi:hypothetical protein
VSLKDDLKQTLDETEWAWLYPHLKRDAVIVVVPLLDLLEVAEKVALDDQAQVADWIQKGLIGKPSSAQLAEWGENPTKKFLSVIVQPYVLIQEHLMH